MHDPLVVAFQIRRPWPSRSRMHDTRPDGKGSAGGRRWAWRMRHTHWNGPAGGCGEACRSSGRDPFPWWKPSSYSPFMTVAGRKRRPVNVSHQWDGPRRRLFRIDRSCFHMDCSSVEHAHRCCTCHEPLPGRSGEIGESPFRCVRCTLHYDSRRVGLRRQATLLLKTIPPGQFHPDTYREADLLFKEARAAKERAEAKSAFQTNYMGT